MCNVNIYSCQCNELKSGLSKILDAKHAGVTDVVCEGERVEGIRGDAYLTFCSVISAGFKPNNILSRNTQLLQQNKIKSLKSQKQELTDRQSYSTKSFSTNLSQI